VSRQHFGEVLAEMTSTCDIDQSGREAVKAHEGPVERAMSDGGDAEVSRRHPADNECVPQGFSLVPSTRFHHYDRKSFANYFRSSRSTIRPRY
jgi:hypothetical protein